MGGLDIATCPSCSLQIKVIYDDDYLKDFIKDRGLENMVEAYWINKQNDLIKWVLKCY